jgi:hypothetical protein
MDWPLKDDERLKIRALASGGVEFVLLGGVKEKIAERGFIYQLGAPYIYKFSRGPFNLEGSKYRTWQRAELLEVLGYMRRELETAYSSGPPKWERKPIEWPLLDNERLKVWKTIGGGLELSLWQIDNGSLGSASVSFEIPAHKLRASKIAANSLANLERLRPNPARGNYRNCSNMQAVQLSIAIEFLARMLRGGEGRPETLL